MIVLVLSKNLGQHIRPATTPFGKWLRQRRLELGLSQEEVGKRIGVSRAAVSSHEIGYRVNYSQHKSEQRLHQLAEVLQLDWETVAKLRPAERPCPYILHMPHIKKTRTSGLAQMLTDIRLRRQLRQAEMARLVGVHQTTWGQWELGRKRPSPKRLAIITANFLTSL